MKRSLTFVLVLIMLLTAACQTSTPTRAVQTQAEAPPEIITIDLGFYERDTFAPIIDQLIAAFEVAHPQYRVRKVDLPPHGIDYLTVLKQRLKAGEYDIIPIISDDREMLEPLDAYLSRSQPDMSRVAEASESLRSGGRLYQIPIILVPEAFVINREMWEAAGLPLPSAGWNWEFRRAAARLTRGEGAGRVWGFGSGFHEYLLSLWLMQKAGHDFWLADEQDLREGLRFFTDLVQLDQSMPAPEQRDWGAGITRVSASQLFPEKQAAIGYSSVQPFSFMNQWLRFPWDVLPVPTRSGAKPVLRVRPWAFSMAASSGEKEVAWAFMRFAAGPEGAAIVAASGGIPADGSAVTQAAWSSLVPTPPAGTIHLLITPWIADGITDGCADTMMMELYRLTNLTLRGELDPDTAVTQYLSFRKRYIKP